MDAVAPDEVVLVAGENMPPGLSAELLQQATMLIVDWEANTCDSNPVHLAVDLFKLYTTGHGIK